MTGRHGVKILESEIIGLVPAAALREGDETHLQLESFSPTQVLENRLNS